MQELPPLHRGDDNLIWHSILDGKYICQVRTNSSSSHQGLFTVYGPGQRLLYTQPVELSHGAIFGPDIDDVNNWKRMAAHFVDSMAKED